MNHYNIKNSLEVRLFFYLLALFSSSIIASFIYTSKIRVIALSLVLLSFLLANRRLVYGVYLFVFSIPFFHLPGVFGRNLVFSEIILFSVLIVFIIKNFGKDLRLRKTKLDIPLIIFLSISLLAPLKTFFSHDFMSPSSILNLDSSSPNFILRILLMTLEFSLAYFLSVNIVEKKHVKNILHTLILTSLITAFYGIHQSHLVARHYYRVRGFFMDPPSLGMFFTLVLPASIFLFFNAKSNKKFIWTIPTVLSFALTLTFSRAAWLAFSASMLFLVTSNKVARKIIFVSLPPLLIAATLMSTVFYGSTSEHQILVDSSEWTEYNFSINPGEHILTIWFFDDYSNNKTNGDRSLYVANITSQLTEPLLVRADAVIIECGDYCFLPIESFFVQTIVNQSFSVMMRGGYAGGWPTALVRVREYGVLEKTVVSPLLIERLRMTLSHFNYRFSIWKRYLGEVKKKPFFGAGWINLDIGGRLEHSHNLYLQLWLERGVFALMAFLWLMALVFRDSSKYSWLSKILVSGIFGVLVYGLFDYVFYSASIGLLFFFYLALIEVNEN